jgi:hypothetical protein
MIRTLEDFDLVTFVPDRRRILGLMRGALQDELARSGAFTIGDAYAVLTDEEIAYAKDHGLVQGVVLQLKEELGLHRIGVENSPEPSRRSGTVGVWTR